MYHAICIQIACLVFQQICMPSGACVRIDSDGTIEIDAIPQDWGKLSGTCGNFNGNRYDDIRKRGTNDVLFPQNCPNPEHCVPWNYYLTWRSVSLSWI